MSEQCSEFQRTEEQNEPITTKKSVLGSDHLLNIVTTAVQKKKERKMENIFLCYKCN